ncbi:MAG TPA: response regulator [Stellaceae bacterium]|nr:response regulator [Stellaceae bacterium]
MSARILVVDDSLTIRMDLMDILGAAGLDAAACASLAEARQALAEERYSLVILDVLLPDGDGIELLQEIRADPAVGATPIMLLSTEAEVNDRVRGMRTGADEYIGKPYEPAYLIARARELLHRGEDAAAGVSETILVIDDSITFREALREALEAAAYRVVLAGTGEDGLRAAAAQRPGAIIVDGLLPGVDGASVIRRIRLDAALRTTPCLLLTGSEDADAELRALDSGADAFVRKEQDTGIILARLTAMLRSAGTPQPRHGAASLLAPKRILTVDDSETYLQALADALRGAGYEVVLARSGEQALELLAVQPVDCILLDLLMPGIGGEEACRRIKTAPTIRDTPIIMLTSLEDRDAMIRGLGAGADDYITKSSDFGVLRARVLAQLRRRQFEDENRLAREELLRKEMEVTEAQAAREMAETRAALAEEQKLRAQMERAAALLEAAPDSVVIVDHADQITMVNAQTEGVFGYPRGELLGRPVEMLIPHWLHRESHRMGWERPFANVTELFGRRRDGSEFPVEVNFSPLTVPEGTLAIGTIRDITDRHAAAQRIQRQLQHLHLLDHITRAIGERQDLRSIFQVVVRSLEDSLPIDFGCVCDYDAVADALQVTCVGAKSEALAQQLMLAEEASIGIDDNGLRCCIEGQLVYEPSIGDVRFPFPERLALSGLGSLVLAPLRSESTVFGVLVAARKAAQAFTSVECEFLRQLSEHVALAAHQARLYGALQQAYDDLRQTQEAMLQEERLRALGQMASGIAHDINNALSPVSLYTESLLEDEANLSARARGYLETIQRAVEDVTETVARMREFYRQREPQLQLAPVQLNRMVEQVVELTRARWSDMPQQRGIMIRALTELLPELPEIMGVESEIREALTNLVFNAVDAMPEGGTLTLRTRLVDGGARSASVTVEVADGGIGMDEEARQHCLEPFFTTKGERGTGLGLAMVFGMVQRHGADIQIDSTPGVGTTVRLVFAVAPSTTTELGQPAPLAAAAGLRLLLIDDDPILLKSLRDALETDGHAIVTANGGEEGLATLHASLDRGDPFAAVITDLGMPYLDGRRVAAAVKEASPATPVILLTGWGRQLMADNDAPPHVDRVLAKPPRLRELREALAQFCQPAG